MSNDIILFATYWNEKDWIEASLAQIDRIDPVEIIICEGCFDLSRRKHSTDGTRSIIEKFVQERDNASLVSPSRLSRLQSIRSFVQILHNINSEFCLNISKPFLKYLFESPYRRNQAITFMKMVNRSEYWRPGMWFMTYDCDQFYTEEVLEAFSSCTEDSDFGLLRADERTFINSFDAYTTVYEDRSYNNMPHKIYSDTIIQPTRDILRICTHRENQFRPTNFWSDHLYVNQVTSIHAGSYHHYKLRPESRQAETWELGDRSEPEWDRYQLQKFDRKHPEIIKKHIL